MSMFTIMFIIVGVLCVGGAIFTFAMFFSPKLRGKMMSKQVKATKYMVDESKEDIESISANLADATKSGVETTAHAVKKGLTKDFVNCKYCGAKISKDARFCDRCGSAQ